ncbi:DsbA family protein [Streptomyces sp. NRRL B-24484]|uniref:DsbA family protein n=1 Tax=Streptomyces sp. NRRL B-24484 TaxID=1463833 RepID=UPI0004C16071|nr:thioredoxin domain-containing protein [Streptomyces sp. NRRL B-24484]
MSTQPQQSRTSARERLQEAHRREKKAAALRRRTVVAVSVVAALAVVGGTVAAIATATSSDADPAASAPLTVPANTTGQDGTVVVYGKADAPHTLQVYEDFRCPVCKQFEASAGKSVQQLADSGQYKIEYHLAAFLDKNLGGKGSRTALAAAGAALNEGVDKFKQFHDVLYANQPDEREDGFGDVNRILELADKVPGLKTAAFTKAVTEGAYRPWAAKVDAAFSASGAQGTPTVVLDGKVLNVFGDDGKPVTGEQWAALVRKTTGG